MALRDEILSNRTFPVSDPITVPGWPEQSETLHFRTLTGSDADKIDEKMIGGDIDGLRALFASRVLCDSKGKRVFFEDDLAALTTMPADPLSWILEHGKVWNKITDADAGAIEGNSGAGQDAGNGSESPATGA